MNARIDYDQQVIELQHDGLSVDGITRLRLALGNDWEIRVRKSKALEPVPYTPSLFEDPVVLGILVAIILIVLLAST